MFACLFLFANSGSHLDPTTMGIYSSCRDMFNVSATAFHVSQEYKYKYLFILNIYIIESSFGESKAFHSHLTSWAPTSYKL